MYLKSDTVNTIYWNTRNKNCAVFIRALKRVLTKTETVQRTTFCSGASCQYISMRTHWRQLFSKLAFNQDWISLWMVLSHLTTTYQLHARIIVQNAMICITQDVKPVDHAGPKQP